MRTNRTVVGFLCLLALAPPAHAQFSKSTLSSQINQNFPDQNTGAITPATTRAFLNNLVNSFQQYTGVNAQVGTTYTIQTSDYGQLVTFNNVGAVAVTLPQAAGSFSTFNVSIKNLGAGLVTVTPQGGSTINGAASFAIGQQTDAAIISDGTNYQVLGTYLSSTSSPTLTGNWTFAPTTGTAITINPAASSLNLGVKINQTVAGAWPAGPAALNWINITSDNSDATSADAFTDFGLYLFHAVGGTSSRGSHQSLFVHQNVHADATTNASGHRDFVGISSQVDTDVNTIFPIQGGGPAANASVGAAGSGYTNGAQVLTVSGGTCTTQPQFNVTVSGNAVASVNSVAVAGSCTIPPQNPVTTTGGGGTGATLNVTYTNPINATLFGFAATVATGAGTTNANGLVGAEIDVQPNVDAINYLIGWNVALQGTHQAFIRSVAYQVSATSGAAGWLYGLGVTTQNGSAGLATTGTVVSVLEAMNLSKGIDFTNATFSGNAWTSTGSSITSSGAANFKQTVSVTGTTTDGYSVTDSTVTGTLASSALHTNSVVVGTSSNHPFVFIANNAEVGSVSETATTAPWVLGVLNTRIGTLALNGNTSGTATITPQAAAGTPTLTIGTTSGTIAASATAPLAISATTGVVTCATCTTSAAALTANQLVIGSGSQAEQTLGSLGTTTTVLHGNAGGAPSFAAVVSADMNITTTTCSSQFVTAISAGGVGTCTTPSAATGVTKVAPWAGGYVAGRIYTGLQFGGVSTASIAANTVYFCQFFVGETHTFTGLSFEVTTAGTAANARLAIYNAAGGQPTSLVIDGGSFAVAGTGMKTVTISQSLAPGVYFLALVIDGTETVQSISATQGGAFYANGTSGNWTTPDDQLNATLTFGAFPATAFTGGMGAATYTNASLILLGIKA